MRRSTVDREDLKPYCKSEKRPHSLGDQQFYYLQVFSKTLLATERRLTGKWFLAVDLSPTFLNTGTIDEAFQQSGKQDYIRHLLKNAAST